MMMSASLKIIYFPNEENNELNVETTSKAILFFSQCCLIPHYPRARFS